MTAPTEDKIGIFRLVTPEEYSLLLNIVKEAKITVGQIDDTRTYHLRKALENYGKEKPTHTATGKDGESSGTGSGS